MARLSTLNKFLPVFTVVLALAALTLGTAKISWADSLNEEMRDFNHFLNQHPRIAADLQRDPSLAYNSRYLNDHDNLKDFLHNHPQVRRQLATSSGYALGAPYAWNSAPYGVYPPYATRPYGVYPPYTTPPYSVYPPYASRRYEERRNESRRYGYDPRYDRWRTWEHR
jgi:hypothetical protein